MVGTIISIVTHYLLDSGELLSLSSSLMIINCLMMNYKHLHHLIRRLSPNIRCETGLGNVIANFSICWLPILVTGVQCPEVCRLTVITGRTDESLSAW